MRLASGIITIGHGGSVVRLRPSLRAALHLERAHGLDVLKRGLAETDIAILLDITGIATADDPLARQVVLDTLTATGIIGLAAIRDAVSRFLIVTFGMDDDAPSPSSSRTTITIEDALVELYEIGTGWLGWTPAETWAATPAEIVAARRGLFAKLKALHGGNENNDQPTSDDPETWDVAPDQVRAGLNDLRALAGAL